MKPLVPLQVTYRGMDRSDSLDERIAGRVAKLERKGQRLLACKVSIEATPHQGSGWTFRVSARLTLPGSELVATEDTTADKLHRNAHVAVRDALDALERQLDALNERQSDHRRVTSVG